MLAAAAALWAGLLATKLLDTAVSRLLRQKPLFRALSLHPGLAVWDCRDLTAALNDWSPSAPLLRFLRCFYDAGSVVVIVLQLLVPGVLLLNVLSVVAARLGVASGADNLDAKAPITLLPSLPGSERNAETVLASLAAFLLALAVHEAGHGVAAIVEGLQLRRLGVFVAGPGLPGAFVAVEDVVHVLPCRSQLRVYSAGALHNLVLAALAFAVALCGSMISPAFYQPGGGAVVADVRMDSPSSLIFQPGQSIMALNEQAVEDAEDFYKALDAAQDGMREWSRLFPTTIAGDAAGFWMSNVGICLEEQDILSMPRSCCTGRSPTSQRPLLLMAWHAHSDQHVLNLGESCTCLDQNELFERLEWPTQQTCGRFRECGLGVCAIPMVSAGEHVFLFSRDNGERLMYEGPPSQLLDGVTMTNAKPWIVPDWLQTLEVNQFSLGGFARQTARAIYFRVPDLLSTFVHKLVKYNVSLGLLNSAAIRFFDGDAVSRSLWRHLWPLKHQKAHRFAMYISTGLFLVNVGISLLYA